ncbi:MAG TPA: hypothetical protein VFR23_03360 [Jiangellaceae bacterium]|nr:hypothetical protein [Jiangellaceae bacterium]
MAVDVAQAIKDLIQRILGDRDTALQYAEDPEGTLAAQGITDGDLSNVDMFQLVSDACGSVPGFQNYGSGGGGGGGGAAATHAPPPSATGHSVEQVMQHLNYVTYVAYEGDETITNIIDQSTNIDQSQNVDVDVAGNLHGDISVDSHDTNVNAIGEGAAAAAGGPAVSGDENLVNTGVNLGQQNTGDNAAQGIALGGDVVQNTGEFTGQQAGDDANAFASAFGEGDATNLQNVTTGPGGAISTGDGDATGNFVYAEEDAVVQTEQGEGNANQHVEQTTGIEAELDLGRGGFDRLDPVANPVSSFKTSEESGSEGESQETFEG